MSVSHGQPDRLEFPTSSIPSFVERHYTTYSVCVALAGWSLASYDFNLLVLTFPDIAKSLHLAPGAVGLLGFIIYAAMFIITFLAGYGMDQYGRKWMWMFCLTSAAIFTGLTYFVQNYWQLAVVRALASGFANSELAISITLVNEQVPSHRRGLLYSISKAAGQSGSSSPPAFCSCSTASAGAPFSCSASSPSSDLRPLLGQRVRPLPARPRRPTGRQRQRQPPRPAAAATLQG